MRMHVNKTKIIAVLGVMAALSTVFTVLGTVISVNTIFFTAAAAFLMGIVVCSYGMGYAAIFYLVCLVLDFLFNPNKLHVFLYLAFAGYILLAEGTWLLLGKMQEGKKKEWLHRGIRFLIFEIFYLPLLFFLPQILVADTMLAKPWFMLVMIPGGIIAWIIYDLAYFAAKKFFIARFAGLMK